MRDLPVRRLASSALCAVLVLGTAGSAAVAADTSPRGRTEVTAPVGSVDGLRARIRDLADAGGVVPPVADLLNAVLKAHDGRLPADRAAKLGKAVRDAIAKASGTAGSPSPTLSPVQANALAALQDAVDKLIATVTAGDTGRVLPAAANVLTSLVKVVLSGVAGGRVPSLPDLPTLPPMPPLPPMPTVTGVPSNESA
ncbi:hypothetical protein AB0C59_13845 [Streptomyces sp. NPDC048664]|uniref:hypothetical protein n=1 Tax=Streptomyces sp. NPDC048664 TaxID=3154505 RepID=UPI00343D1956